MSLCRVQIDSMAPSPGLNLKCTGLTVELQCVSMCVYVSVCERAISKMILATGTMKHKNCMASVTAVKALTLTVCLVNQIFPTLLIIYIMYKFYFYCFGDCSGLMPGQSYVS